MTLDRLTFQEELTIADHYHRLFFNRNHSTKTPGDSPIPGLWGLYVVYLLCKFVPVIFVCVGAAGHEPRERR